MGSAARLFDRGDRDAIQDAIRRAELRTSGEIVPVVASSSGRYDRAEGIVGILVAIAFVIVGWNLLAPPSGGAGDWSGSRWFARGIVQIVVLIVAGYAVGTALATWIPALRLPFIRRQELEQEVERAAAESFHRFRLRDTADGTGIAIYVSLFEHRVVVLGDDAIAAKLDHGDWEVVRDLLLVGLRNKKPREGLVAAIERCGEILSAHFPITADDENELGNELHVLD